MRFRLGRGTGAEWTNDLRPLPHRRSGCGSACGRSGGKVLIAHRTDGLMILGIDAENVRRLKAGQPILKALSQPALGAVPSLRCPADAS